MSYTVGMLSLGCAKNRVDAEMILSTLKHAGYRIIENVFMSDIAIVNTCGFIENAKRESIEEILNLIDLKQQRIIKSIIITGCLSERYQQEVANEFPEVDAVIGIGANADIANIVSRVLNGEKISMFPSKLNLPMDGSRIQTTPKHYAYLKIADGCDNRCTYCAIPIIRGPFRSRTMENIVNEAKLLAKNGVKELLVIAQDTTRYGEDIYGKLMLPKLLRELCKIKDIKWIRLLYCYPDRITDELIDAIAAEDKILNYIDLPLQHCNGRILKLMNRRGNKESLTNIIKKIRNKIPNIILRTTFICGFPSETDEEFNELAEFCREIGFDRVGCFAYSKEDGTKAAEMVEQIDENVKLHRQELLMDEQMVFMGKKFKEYIGKTICVLVEEFDEDNKLYIGRSKTDSPDIDGRIIFSHPIDDSLIGEFVNVKIDSFNDFDLIGEMVGINYELA